MLRYLTGGPPFYDRPYWEHRHPTTFWIHNDPLYIATPDYHLRFSVTHISSKYALKYKWRHANLPFILRSFAYSSAERQVLVALDLDPTAVIPEPNEYRIEMSVCMHHPKGQIHPAVKKSVVPPSNENAVPPTKREAAQIQQLISVINKLTTKSPTVESVATPRKAGSLPLSKPISLQSTSKEYPPRQQSAPTRSPSRRQSISSSDDSSVIVTMHVNVPIKSVLPANPVDNPSTPASAVKTPPIQSSNSEPTRIPTSETLLEWSARMKRYQQEEIKHLGLDVIKSNSPQIKSHAQNLAVTAQNPHLKSPRNSPTQAIPPSDKSLSKERFAEWLDTLSPASPTNAVSESSTIVDTETVDVFLDAMGLGQLNLNFCRGCGRKCDNKCRDWGDQAVIKGPLIDI
jgi:hypothetical protein